MKYIRRELERKFMKASGFFKAVLVTGARQVGKTTMLKELAKKSKRTYVSLDDIDARALAKRDPKLFFQRYQVPILIDEVQKAPELFEQIKIICDESSDAGLFWLTGSQQYSMIKNVRETLAGRIAILQLYGLSQREKARVFFEEELDFSLKNLIARQKKLPKNNVRSVFEHIWQGSMPQLVNADAELRSDYYNSYVNSYIMRDIADAGGISDFIRFGYFLKACAALTAEVVNYNTLAVASGITQPTAKKWLEILEGLGIIYILHPYSNNKLKRLVKTPKLYFTDTGLCAYLSKWAAPDTLEAGSVSGHYYENYVVMELVKNYAYSKTEAEISFYRDANQKEVDLFIETDGAIHPFEIKKAASPDIRLVKKYDFLDRSRLKRGVGGIICMAEEPLPIDDNNIVIPSNLI